MMPEARVTHDGPAPSWSLRIGLAVAVLGLLPIAGLGFYAHHLAARTMREMAADANGTAANVSRRLVEREMANHVADLRALASNPAFAEAVAARDGHRVRFQLASLVEHHEQIDRAFVTDPAGLLWSDHPAAPESLGRNFSHREWYQGLSATWDSHVTGVYRRHAEPRYNVVAVAVAIRDPDSHAVLGAAVSQVRLESITAMLEAVEVGAEGYLCLVDATGLLAAHPRVDLQAGDERRFGQLEGVRAALAGSEHSGLHEDPVTGRRMRAVTRPVQVGNSTWALLASQAEASIEDPIRDMGRRIFAAGIVLGIVLAILFFALARLHQRALRLNQCLRQANDELEARVAERGRALAEKESQLHESQKMDAIGRLAGGMAHDFNNLLTIIQGHCELLLQQAPQGPYRGGVEQIHAAGARASTLTRQLLAFSRKQVQVLGPVNLTTLVERCEPMLRSLAGENVSLRLELQPGLRAVLADVGQMEQVLMNLVVNARDAMPEGGSLVIETSDAGPELPGPGTWVMLAVSDSGFGMDEETRARVFEPFFTTKGRGRGTGLGLATVHGIISQTGGHVGVESAPGQGATFRAWLPCSDEPAEAAPAALASAEPAPVEEPEPEAAPRPGAGASAGEPARVPAAVILVAEDEPALRDLVTTLLTRSGYRVLAASCTPDALALHARHGQPVDLLLTDVIMPGRSGRELAEELGAIQPGLRVLYMSGYTDDIIAAHGVLEPGTHFIQKPMSARVLLAKIREMLDDQASDAAPDASTSP